MVLRRAFRARHVRTNGIGGEVRHGVASGVSRETALNEHVTPRLRWEYADCGLDVRPTPSLLSKIRVRLDPTLGHS